MSGTHLAMHPGMDITLRLHGQPARRYDKSASTAVDCARQGDVRDHGLSVAPDLRRHLIEKYATNTVSVQLDDTLKYFVGPDRTALTGYLDRAGVAVVMGDPVGRPEDAAGTIKAFLATKTRRGSRAIFVSASAQLASAAEALNCGAIKIGEEAVFDLDRHSFAGGAMKRLRHHEARARRQGVEASSLAASDLPGGPDAAELAAVIDAWLGQHAMGSLGFLLLLRPLCEPDKSGKRIFVARQHGKVVAFLTAVPIVAANGVYLEDYVRRDGTPDGTAELLFRAACDDLRGRGYDYVTLGTAPLANLGSCDRGGSAADWVLRRVFDHVSWPYDFKSLLAFKARFHPTRWVPKYLVYERPFTPRSAAALALAFWPGGGLTETIRRLPDGWRSRRRGLAVAVEGAD